MNRNIYVSFIVIDLLCLNTFEHLVDVLELSHLLIFSHLNIQPGPAYLSKAIHMKLIMEKRNSTKMLCERKENCGC